MEEVDISLTAKNSSGEQKLYLQNDDGEYYFTLCGEYRGDKMQIDFDEVDRSKLEEMRAQIDLILSAQSV